MHPFICIDAGKEILFGDIIPRHGKQVSGNKEPNDTRQQGGFDLFQDKNFCNIAQDRNRLKAEKGPGRGPFLTNYRTKTTIAKVPNQFKYENQAFSDLQG